MRPRALLLCAWAAAATSCEYERVVPSNASILTYGLPHCSYISGACLLSSTCSVMDNFTSDQWSFVGAFDYVGNFSSFPGTNLTLESSAPLNLSTMVLPNQSTTTLYSITIRGASSSPEVTFPPSVKRFTFQSSAATSIKNQDWSSLEHIILDGTPLTSLSNWTLGANLSTFSCSACALQTLRLNPGNLAALENATVFIVQSIAFNSDACDAVFGVQIKLRKAFTVCVVGAPASSSVGVVLLAVGGTLLLVGGAVYLFRQRTGDPYLDDDDESIDSDAAMSPDLLADLEPFRLAHDAIEFNSKLSHGTYGDVWLASAGPDTVAVKVLRRHHRSSGVAAAFLREVHLMSTLQSPFIVALRGVVLSHPTKLLCVMEFMDKGDLRTSLKLNAHLPWAVKVQVAVHVARALAYLHDRRIVHRDVKSRNVLLNSAFGAKLADFGVATTGRDRRPGRHVVGTHRWMAPEVLREQPSTAASDVYSFGVVLFELDSHKAPFEDHCVGDDRDMVDRMLNGELALEFSDVCPPWVRRLARQCMSDLPELRPTAHQLVHMIQENSSR